MERWALCGHHGDDFKKGAISVPVLFFPFPALPLSPPLPEEVSLSSLGNHSLPDFPTRRHLFKEKQD